MARIGIDARLTHYRVGGISRYITAVIGVLEELAPAHDIRLVQSRKSDMRLSRRFPSVSAWTPPHHRLERSALSLELWRHRFDLLHSPDFIAPKRGASHHVITIHDLSFLHYPEYITAESRRYYNGQIKASIQRADHILVDSRATKRDLIEILNVKAEAITVHALGVDESFAPLPPERTAPVICSLGLPSEFILFVGTLEPRKNLVGLAEAYRDLLLELPDAPMLVIAGRPGWHFDELMSDLNAVGIGERIVLRHDIADAQLPALYSQAIALVAPSFYEGFGLTALEAMACGAVPIVSDKASLPEVVGDVGALIDPHNPDTIAEALKKALTDSRWREEQAAAARQRAAGFRWIDTARCVLECYEAVLN
ncbi:MAG: glycosyltransferase family 1 protein [Chloroflexi bacterium]|nr:glycosyltransferase family 1 protein [Chloroflexota bacterium]